MRIVTIAPYVPSPTMPYAGGQWYWHLLGQLSTDAEVTLVAPDVPDNASRLAETSPTNWRTLLAPSETRRILAKALWRTGLNKYFLGMRSGLPTLDGAVRSAIDAADAVDLQWSEAAALIPKIRRRWPSTPIGVTEHDVCYHAAETASPPEPIAAALLRRQELRYLNRADAVFAFKQPDIDLLRSAGLTCERVALVDPWFDLPSSVDVSRSDRSAIFVAAWDRPSNVDGAIWVIDEVWPRVVEALPDARLVLAGGNPPDELRRRQASHIRVTGYVADLNPLYLGATVALSVSFNAGGLKFKVPQAMAYGLPVVATSAGAQGIADAPPFALSIRDDAEGFACAMVGHLTDGVPDLEAQRIRTWVQQRFDRRRTAATMLSTYRDLLG